MKKVYLFLLLCVAGFAAQAQTAATYAFSRTIGTYVSISGGSGTVSTTAINSDDVGSTGIPIGFSFDFCGASSTQLAICSNGWVSLANNGAVGSLGGSSTYVTTGKLMPFWGDNHGGYSPSICYYQTTGSAGSRVFTFEWNNWNICCASGYNQNYQVKLYEGSNIIQFCYGAYQANISGRVIGIGNSTSDYLTLTNESSTTASTSFSSGCQLPPNGTILNWCPPTPSILGGSTAFCSGTTTTLSNPAAGGVWTSGNLAVATIGSSTGIATGVAGGTATITYTPQCGNPATKVITVNPAPAIPTGNVPVCVGSTILLTDASGAGSWASSNTSIASINSSTGVLTGVSAGSATITFTLAAGGCQTTTPATVNPLPPAITGLMNVCPGFTTTLSNSLSGGSWTSSNTAMATVVGGTGVVTGVSAGTPLISYTNPVTGCANTAAVTVYPNTSPITGVLTVCPAATTALSDATSGGTWAVSTPSIATVGAGTGIVSGVTNGTTTITYTDPNGCYAVNTVTVFPNPPANGGISNACIGFSSTLSNSIPGGTWSSTSPSIATVDISSGVVTGVTGGIANIIYTLGSTGCKATTSFLVNSQPASITGVNNACVGANSALSDATPGGSWTSANTTIATVAGTGIVSGVAMGSTLITYTLATGCYRTISFVINPLPTIYAVNGGGVYCAGGAGVHVGLVYSSSGIEYQLLLGGVPVGAAVPGANSSLDFGLQTAPGTYTVTALNPITGCTNTMSGSVTISVNTPPIAFSVNGGGGYCVGGAGVMVGLDNSEAGVNYQLFNGLTAVGTVVPGTGLPISFGSFTTAGTYTAKAVNATTGCSSNMTSSVDITVNPLPVAYNVTGGGHFCAGSTGVHVGLSGSDAGVVYSLYRGITFVSSITSPGGALDFGIMTTAGVYTITAVDGSGCGNNMVGSVTVIVDPLPVVYNVTGGGGYCAGSAGVHVGLSFSSTGIDYQLWYGGTLLSTTHGSGSGLDFGIQLGGGLYNVVAVNPVTGCTEDMSGVATVSVNTPPNVYGLTGGGNYCLGTAGVHIYTSLSETGVNYQLYRGITLVGAAVPGTGGSLDFGVFTIAGTYTAVATNPLTGCTAPVSGSATVGINTLPASYSVTGGGSYCLGGAGVDIVLSNSELNIDYALLLDGIPVGIILSGTGSALHFGLQSSAGVYTVVANNYLTGCTRNMAGSAAVSINALPNTYNVTGGGTYCAGGTGLHIGLDGSATGFTYQLYDGGSVAIGTPMAGSGGALDFGLKTAASSYYVVAKNPLTTCTVSMIGTATINIQALPGDHTVIGGGPYCSGGTGVDVSTAGSDINVNYQLYRSGLPIGAPVSGTGLDIHFGLQTIAGVYTVRATDLGTTCSKNMPGSATVTIISNTDYLVTGGGSYCATGAGVHVGLGGSQTGVDYQLWNTAGPVGTAIAGTGSAIDFGLETAGDVYIVVATNATYFCTDTMAGSRTVVVNPLPDVHNVTGGGRYCVGSAGAPVGLDLSDGGIKYQLYNGTSAYGSVLAGTGAALDFPLVTATGSYTVIATNAVTGCSSNMTGSATVTANPLPTAYRDSITGPNPAYPGYFCAADTGVHIYMLRSDTGVQYQLWRGATMVGTPVAGSGGVIDLGLQIVAGTYTVQARDITTSCINNMMGSVTVHIVNLPNVHNVTGGGVFCAGTTGVHVGLDGSDPGFTYELFDGPYSAGILFGTGGALDFGIQTAVGNYTILGNNVITDCPNNMFGSANVAHTPLPTPVVTMRAFPGTGVGVWHIDSMRVDVLNGGDHPTFQWFINRHLIAGATNSSFTNHEFFNNDVVSCKVTASGPCGGNTTEESLTVTLFNVGVNTIAGNGSEIKLMPNPNKGIFMVKGTLGTNVTEDITIEVVNMLGQVVYRNNVTAHNGEISEQVQLNSGMANGMYILNVRSATQNTVFHFVIEQ